MIGFKSRIIDNEIKKGESLIDHIKNLYDVDSRNMINFIYIPKINDVPLYKEDLEWAISKLCKDKA